MDFAKLLAEFLDRQFVIPGTSIRIGLDPIIGLIPGIGDILTSAAGSAILFFAAQYRLPKIVLFRMGINISLNGLLGAIPVFGDIFSIWFKSNVRNISLLEQYVNQPRPTSTFGDWVFVLGLFLGIFALLVGMLVGMLSVCNAVTDLAHSCCMGTSELLEMLCNV